MKIYFLSALPCKLTLNGAFFGIVDNFERSLDVHLSDKIFVEFTPQGANTLAFFLTEDLLESPPEGLEVYHLKNGVALYAKSFPPIDYTLRPLTQKKFGGNLVTLFQQGQVHLSLETEKGFFISTLPPSFANSTLSFHEGLFFIEGENSLAIYTKWGDCVFMEQILQFSVEGNTLNAYLPLSDSLNRVANCAFSLSETGCQRTKFVITQQYTREGDSNPKKLSEELLPYVFFESVLLKEDYISLLSEELKPKAQHIQDFLGDFIGVTLTSDPNTYGLIYRKGERVFSVVEHTIMQENGKIMDIKV